MGFGVAITEVDILVVGGGPAGLLAASYLSENHSVALIERSALGQTKKYWLTTERRLKTHGLDHCVLHRARTLFAGTFLGTIAYAEGDLTVVDDESFLQTLVERCRTRGVAMHENCGLLNIAWTTNYIEAQSECGTFHARLVLDATGGLSPISSTFRLHQIDGFFSVYGVHMDNIELRTADVVLGYVYQLGDPPPGFELYPTGSNSGYCALFVYSKFLVTAASLAASFEKHCLHNPFFNVTPLTTRSREKMGAIPIGRKRNRTLSGVVSIGEAGMVQPPLMGTAFNEVLEYTVPICNQISRALQATVGIPVLPKSLYPLRKRAQDRYQLFIVRILVAGNVEMFDNLLAIFSRFSRKFIFKFFSNELTGMQLAYLLSQVPWFRLMRYRAFGR